MKSRIFGTEFTNVNENIFPSPDDSNLPPVPDEKESPGAPAADSTGTGNVPDPGETGFRFKPDAVVVPDTPAAGIGTGDEGISPAVPGEGGMGIPFDGGSSGGSSGGGIRGSDPMPPSGKGAALAEALKRFTQASFRIGSKRIPVWALTIILLLIVIIIIIAAGSSSGGGKSTSSKYKEQFNLVERFELAYNRHDYYAMFECFDPAVMKFYSGMLSIGMSLGGANISSSDLQDVLPGLSQMFGASGVLDDAAGQVDFIPYDFVGNEAGGVVVYHVKLKKPGQTEEFDQAAELIKVDGKWYFSNTQRDQKTLMTMIEQRKYEPGSSYGFGFYNDGNGGGGW